MYVICKNENTQEATLHMCIKRNIRVSFSTQTKAQFRWHKIKWNSSLQAETSEKKGNQKSTRENNKLEKGRHHPFHPTFFQGDAGEQKKRRKRAPDCNFLPVVPKPALKFCHKILFSFKTTRVAAAATNDDGVKHETKSERREKLEEIVSKLSAAKPRHGSKKYF